MSTAVYPPLPPSRLLEEEEASRRRELDWLLCSLQQTFGAIKEGLTECAALMAPREPGSTLVVSTPRADSVKGFVTRRGTRVIRGDMQLRMQGLPFTKGRPYYRLTISTNETSQPLVLRQLVNVGHGIDQALDVVDVSTWTGDASNASFIAGQLRLLLETIRDATQSLKGPSHRHGWVEDPVDPSIFDPPLPENCSFHLCIADAALRLELRTLEPGGSNVETGLSGFGFRDRIAVAIGAAKKPDHDEADEVFMYRGQEVRVKEKVIVDSQDPSLMAAMAKLAALEHHVAAAQRSLATVMEEDIDD